MNGQYGRNTPSEVDCSLLGGEVAFDDARCFSFICTAAIYRDNPSLMVNTSNESTQAFIELRVSANMIVLLVLYLRLNLISYSQDSFPLAFGDEV